MAQILVRDLDEEVVTRLEERARRQGRSLQSEVKVILEREASIGKVDMETARKRADEIRSRFEGRELTDSVKLDPEAAWKAVDEFRSRFKGRKFTDSVKLLREDRYGEDDDE